MSNFQEIKKRQNEIVMSADKKGYEFNDIELSVLSKVGRAESEKDISPYLEEAFYKLYFYIKRKMKG